jgi:uncharacterized protein (DUF433 family)
MERIAWQERIAVDPAVHHGEVCIKGTRIPVRILLGSLADGMTYDDIATEYPQLSKDDIRAVLAYAAEVLHEESLLPLGA